MWLVTASSITEPMAESASHCSWLFSGTGVVERAFASASKPFRDKRAVPAHSSAKAPNRNDQAQPSVVRSKAGSNSTGKPSSASSEARFDSANRR